VCKRPHIRARPFGLHTKLIILSPFARRTRSSYCSVPVRSGPSPKWRHELISTLFLLRIRIPLRIFSVGTNSFKGLLNFNFKLFPYNCTGYIFDHPYNRIVQRKWVLFFFSANNFFLLCPRRYFLGDFLNSTNAL